MKFIKAIAFASIVAIAANAQAQSEYAPEKGDFSVEIQFNPFSNDFSTFKVDQLKGRWFMTDKDALRFGIGFGVDTNKNVADPEEHKNDWSKTRTGNFSINLGYERNVFNYKRINLYAGAGLGFAMQSTCSTNQQDMSGETRQTKVYNANSYNEFTVQAFTGIDFFVYKGLYLGAEFGIKLGVKNHPQQYSKGGVNPETGDWSDDYEFNKGGKSNSFLLGTYAEPAIRLGWQF